MDRLCAPETLTVPDVGPSFLDNYVIEKGAQETAAMGHYVWMAKIP
jgi:hypothetical protein